MTERSIGRTAATWTRRGLLATAGLVGGGLALGLALAPNRLKMTSPGAARGEEVMLNTWVKITPDNLVTVLIPHSEMGQGAGTGLAQMLAEELDADWSRVAIEDAPATSAFVNSDLGRGYIVGEGAAIPEFVYPLLDFAFLQIAGRLVGQMTGGSTAIRLTGHHGMRRAGAAARGMLIQAAAEAWGLPAAEIETQAGRLRHARTAREATYGEMATRAARFAPSLKPPLKDPSRYTIVGQPVRRLDLPGLVDGSAVFAMDVAPTGLRHAALLPAPVVGARVAAIDAARARRRPGVERVVDLGDAVAVIADSYWTASKACADLAVSWRGGDETLSSASLRAAHEAALERGARERVDSAGDPVVAGGREVTASYGAPYLAHACMEPLNCTARVTPDACELWLGHQNHLFARAAVASELGLDPERVTIHKARMGGGFGRKGRMDFVLASVRVARAMPGVPVKLIWSREADMTGGGYRPATVARLAGTVQDGLIRSFRSVYIDAASGMPDSERPFAFQYDVPNRLAERVRHTSPVSVGTWRAVDFTQMGFYHECFMDELAETAGADPLAFRLRHTRDPRARAVLERLSREADWAARPARPRGLGVAMVASFDAIVAQAVSVAVENGAVKVEKVVSVVDCGRVINPDSARAQVTGSVVFGLAAALNGEITLERGRVVQRNFPDYPMPLMRDVPLQAVHFIGEGRAPGGLGEPAVPPVAPALANAIHAATGTRLRELPIGKHGFRMA